MVPMPKDLISTAEAAELLGRSVSTISRLVLKGELTPVHRAAPGKGGAMVFDRSEIDRYLIDLAAS